MIEKEKLFFSASANAGICSNFVWSSFGCKPLDFKYPSIYVTKKEKKQSKSKQNITL